MHLDPGQLSSDLDRLDVARSRASRPPDGLGRKSIFPAKTRGTVDGSDGRRVLKITETTNGGDGPRVVVFARNSDFREVHFSSKETEAARQPRRPLRWEEELESVNDEKLRATRAARDSLEYFPVHVSSSAKVKG